MAARMRPDLSSMGSTPAASIDTAALLSSIVQSSSDAIFSVDLDGIITSWNRAAEKLYGYSSAEALGQPNELIIPLDRRAEDAAVVSRIKQGDVMQSYQTVR